MRLFFSLLRHALWGGEPGIQVSEVTADELRRVVGIARAQTVLGLVANEILKCEELRSKLEEGEIMRLKRSVMSNLSSFQMLNGTLVGVVKELRKCGIEPVLLKGQGIAQYYPVPELRQCGDIDIYVGEENFAKSCEIIGAMSSPEDKLSDIPSLKHFHTHIGVVTIEIHRYTDVYFPKRYDVKYQKISDDGMHSELVPLNFSGVEVMTPSVDFNVFFIFNHFWHHFIADGVGLRQICDWACLLHANRERVNENKLSDILCRMGLMKQWKAFGCIAVDVLGLPANEMPFYDTGYGKLSGKVLELIMREGNFGKENHKKYRRPKGYFAGKLYSLMKHVERDLRVLSIFPLEALRNTVKVLVVGVAVIFSDKFVKYKD